MSTEAIDTEKKEVTPEPIPAMAPIHSYVGDTGGGAAPPPRTATVMEIDPAAPAEVQAKEYAEAMAAGMPVVMKGGALPAGLKAPEAAKKNEEDEGAELSPIQKFFAKGAEADVELPPPTPAVQEYLKAAGLDIKELSALPRLKVEMSNLQQLNADQEAKLALLGGLSVEAQNVLAKDLAGEDWRTAMRSQPNFNYEKPYSKQDQRKVTEAFSDIKLTDDDWADYESEDGDPRAKRLVEQAIALGKKGYEEARSQELNYGQTVVAQEQERAQKYGSSLNATMAQVNRIEGIAPYAIALKKQLTKEGILSHFFEKDGVSLKLEAGLDFLAATNRKAMMGVKEQVISAKAETDATIRQLRRTEERPIPGTKGAGKQDMTPEQYAAWLFGQGMKGQ